MNPPRWTPEDLLDQLAPQVAAEIRDRGERLAYERQVGRLDAASDGTLKARVGRERVALTFGVEEVAGRCSCRSGEAVCEHIWAALVEARDQGVVPRLVGGAPTGAWVAELERIERAARASQVHVPPWPSTLEILYVVGPEPPAGLALSWGTRRSTGRNRERLSPRLVSRHARPAGLSDEDWSALSVLGSLGPGLRYSLAIPSRVHCPAALAPLVLPVLARTGRLLAARTEGQAGAPALSWDPVSWRAGLVAEPDDRTGQVAIKAVLARDGAPHVDPESFELVAAGIARIGATLAPVELGSAPAWLDRKAKLTVPKGELARAVARLQAMPGALPLFDDGLRELVTHAGTPDPVLAVDAPDTLEVGLRVYFQYGPGRVAHDAPGPLTPCGSTGGLIRRDAAAERARLAELATATGDRLRVRADELPAVVEAMGRAGWVVEAAGQRVRTGGRFAGALTSGVDWFDLSGDMDFDGAAAGLADVLAALRNGSAWVRLGDGTTGLLPADWLARFGMLAELGQPVDQGLRFGRAQLGFVDGLIGDAVPEDQCAEARAALRSFDRIEAAAPPAGFEGTLRPYQEEGLGWMRFLDRFGFGGCLADDVGLGKTVQVLALLAGVHAGPRKRGAAPSLIVMPRSLLENWKGEAARFAPALDVVVHHGTGRARERRGFAGRQVVLTTYGTLRRDAALFQSLAFDYLVIDEAQMVKNADTDSARVLRAMTARRRLALTGTPVENRLAEIANLMDFLNPGFFGRQRRFPGGERLTPELAETVRGVLRPFLLRRTKAAVARDLPARTEQTLWCPLEPAQRTLYDGLRAHYRKELLGGTTPGHLVVLEALLRLRQAACHTALLGDRVPAASAKLDLLIPRLAELAAEGHKVLVFSQFTRFLALVRQALEAAGLRYEYLDGATRDRAERVARFQSDAGCPVFLISLRAGGTGLNLTAADYVFVLDPWWNPAVEAQAIDRAHRIGQQRPVVACRLVAPDTVEERILALQADKRALADAILAEEAGPLARLTRADLERLLE